MKSPYTQKKVITKGKFEIKMATIGLLLIWGSCAKESDNTCYECKALIEKKDSQILIESSSSTTSYCDKSESEIKALEEKNNYEKIENGIEVKSTFKCEFK